MCVPQKMFYTCTYIYTYIYIHIYIYTHIHVCILCVPTCTRARRLTMQLYATASGPGLALHIGPTSASAESFENLAAWDKNLYTSIWIPIYMYI